MSHIDMAISASSIKCGSSYIYASRISDSLHIKSLKKKD